MKALVIQRADGKFMHIDMMGYYEHGYPVYEEDIDFVDDLEEARMWPERDRQLLENRITYDKKFKDCRVLEIYILIPRKRGR